MGLTKLTAAAMFLAASLYTSWAVAQSDTSAPKTNQPASQTDEATPPISEQAGHAATSDSDSNGEEKPSCRWCKCGKLADPWTLPQPDCLKERNVTVGGWLDGGIYGNQWGAPNNGPVGLRSIGDGFTARNVSMGLRQLRYEISVAR